MGGGGGWGDKTLYVNIHFQRIKVCIWFVTVYDGSERRAPVGVVRRFRGASPLPRLQVCMCARGYNV